MLERLGQALSRNRCRYSSGRTNTVLRLIWGIAQAGILIASIWFIYKEISAGYATVSAAQVRLEPHRLIVSGLCTAASTALGAWEWALFVNALGGRLDIAPGMKIHLVSNLAKYVPGFIWPYVGKTYLASQQGVPAGIAALSVACEFFALYFAGFLVLLLSLPFSGIVSWSRAEQIAFQMGAVLLTGLGILGIPLAGRWVTGRAESMGLLKGVTEKADWRRIRLIVLAVLLTWCLLGFGFSILNMEASPLTWQALSRWTFALASALLIGQLAVFAPVGIGVREAVFVTILRPDGSSAVILLLALTFRILMMIGEVLSTLVAWIVDRTCAASQK